jgi:hypothetical protein
MNVETFDGSLKKDPECPPEISPFSYFQRVQLWKHKTKPFFRFFSHNTMRMPPEWKDYSWEEDWEMTKIFYAFSSNYKGILSRGYLPVRIVNEENYPYRSLFVDTPMSSFSYRNTENFIVFLYPFLDSIPLFISTNGKPIHDVVLYDKKSRNDVALNTLYNFFPSTIGESTPWYKKYTPFSNSKFFYVFSKEPSYSHWTISTEKIILPSTTGFSTIEKAVIALNERLRYGFSQGNKTPLLESNTQSCGVVWYIMVALLFVLGLLLLWIASCKITHSK